MRMDSIKLNKLIGAEAGAQALLGLHQQHGESFNQVNLATCWSRLGRANSAEERGWLQSDDGARLLTLPGIGRCAKCELRWAPNIEYNSCDSEALHLGPAPHG